ncbi:MAG TPA: hypothetical protein DCS35_07490 [Vibrio sp.]|nr:hypothetical protein [Vibrio sp.]
MSTSIKAFFVIVALVAGFFADDALSWLNSSSKAAITDYCQLSTNACEKEGIAVTLNRDTAQPLIPIQINVDWPHSEADSLHLTLEGYEMEMGTARFAIAQINEGQYQGDVLLPACTMEAMTWVGKLSNGKQSIDVAIRMER